MSSIVEKEKTLLFGLAEIPDNFVLFNPEKQKLWFEILKKQVSDNQTENFQEFIGIQLSREQALQIDDNFIKLFEQYFPDSKFVIDVTNSGLFTNEEFSKISNIKDKLQNKNNFLFSENFSFYDFEKVCFANNKLNSWADEINNLKINGKNLSPLEKFYIAYSYITRFDYKDSQVDSYESRNLINVLNSNKIVCVGYAQMLKSLCTLLEINCEVQIIVFDKDDLNHMNCMVSIKDEKYGVDGVFYSDPCFDSSTNGRVSFSHALISYNDIPNLFTKHWLKFSDEKDYDFRYDITSSKKPISETLKEVSEFLYSQKDSFSKYIDESVKNKNSFLITKTASKNDLHNIIDKIIEDYLIKINFGGINSRLNAYESELIDRINKEDLAEMILTHTKTRNLDKFKDKLFEEMKTYLPEYDSTAFCRLCDGFIRHNTANKNEQVKTAKPVAKNLTYENFDKLIKNLKSIEGQSEAFDPRNIDKIILYSAFSSSKMWGENINSNNAFAILSNIFSSNTNEDGTYNIKTGEKLLDAGREYIKNNPSKQIDSQSEKI